MKITPLFFETYMALIKNSVGSNMFRNSYAEIDGEKKDILEDGEISCGFHTSSILAIYSLIKNVRFIENVHATISSTVRDMQEMGWQIIEEPRIGSIILWEANGSGHKHLGFYMGDNQAISNSSRLKAPAVHDWTYGGERKVEAIYWHPKLSE